VSGDRSVCWFCDHFDFTPSSPGYSEWTPGSDASISCGKGVWEFDMQSEDEESFRSKLTTSTTCDKFKPRR
jgi:hypothetical protein